MTEHQARNLDILSELGFTQYERRTLSGLMLRCVADAETLCREGAVPSSKIYLALEKLRGLGLVQVQPTRPRLYSVLHSEAVFDRLAELAKEKAERFAKEAKQLKEHFANLPSRDAGRAAFVDLAIGRENHAQRHLIHLAAAKTRIWSYVEMGDLQAIEATKSGGTALLRRIARNATEHSVDHRVVFGFSYRTAPKLLAFLKKHRNQLSHVTGVRYSSELGHPFHVIDEAAVILSVDHPFVPDGRVASLLVRDAALAKRLATGFEALWKKAMRSLSEISFHPHGS